MTAIVMGCNSMSINMDENEDIGIIISLACPSFESRSDIPDEDTINDINLLIFEEGKLEYRSWIRDISDTGTNICVNLLKGHRYSFFAAANMGKEISCADIEDIHELTADIGMAGDFPYGLPMVSYMEDILIENDSTIDIRMERLAAKISLKIDRSRLSEGVSMEVIKVKIGNWPKYASVLVPNKVETPYDCFDSGFELDKTQCAPLNKTGRKGLSEEVSLYMLENMQGDFPYDIGEDEEKVFEEDDIMASVCSYVEMEIYYTSNELISYDSNLKYRFYLGDGQDNLDVERNSHYHITVTPEDDGLSGSGWRVDKSGIGPSVPKFDLLPGDYIEGRVGEDVHIWCDFYPKSAPFEIDQDELNYDKRRGIYNYTMDKDGHGVTLHLRSPGTGMVKMSAGEPINKSEIAVIIVNP